MEESRKWVRRLHIGGWQPREGWEILDANPRAGVDHVGDASDLSRFADGTFTEVYASHVLEHFDYADEIPRVLREWLRVLQPGGTLYVAVPDMERLCHLYLTPRIPPAARLDLMKMIFGSHADAYDYHMAGLDETILGDFLQSAGFTAIRRVGNFQLFEDTSNLRMIGVPISLNMIANRPSGD